MENFMKENIFQLGLEWCIGLLNAVKEKGYSKQREQYK